MEEFSFSFDRFGHSKPSKIPILDNPILQFSTVRLQLRKLSSIKADQSRYDRTLHSYIFSPILALSLHKYKN